MVNRMLCAFVVALSLAACSGAQPAAESASADAAAPGPLLSSDSGAAPAAAEARVAGSAGPEKGAPAVGTAAIALDGEGLRVFAIPSGSSRLIAFGTARADAVSMLAAVQGGPPVEEGENIDCGATLVVWPDGLTTWFMSGQFVGWSVGAGESRLTTADGLGLGTTRGDVEDGATVAEIGPSSLGTEFFAGGVAGLLDSDAPDARVIHLWSGQACIAR